MFFDNLQVSHTRGPLLEEDHYYPFGLTMAGISDKTVKAQYAENKYRFIGQLYDDDLGWDTYQMKYRTMDPQLGRFWQVDPLATQYVYNSTYAYAEDRVVNGIDLEGAEYFMPDAAGTTAIAHTLSPNTVTTQDVQAAQNAQLIANKINGKVATVLAIGLIGLAQPEVGVPLAISYLTGAPTTPSPQAFATTEASASIDLLEGTSDASKAPAPSSLATFETPKLDGSFLLTDETWSRYPVAGEVPKPEGPFRMVEGPEYQDALKAKNSANAAINKANPSLKGMHIHEIQPVKFGGSPTDPANKITLQPEVHQEYTSFWNSIMYGNRQF